MKNDNDHTSHFLKRLELNGFKSFAGKTVLEFPAGIVAVVGPNGSGKSNIVDALRWLLGERDAKNLRGARVEDLIFAGTQKRARVAFEFIEKLGAPFYAFHDRDVAPEGATLAESNRNLDAVAKVLKEEQKRTGIKLLWGTACLFAHPRYAHGAATSCNADVFAYAAAQVKKALEVTGIPHCIIIDPRIEFGYKKDIVTIRAEPVNNLLIDVFVRDDFHRAVFSAG